MSERKIRILYFVDRLLRGGIQTLLWNIACGIDRSRFDVEFLTLDDGKTYPMEGDLREIGCVVHKLDGIWLDSLGAFVIYKKALRQFFRDNESYDVVHVHSSSKNYLFLEEAQRAGVPVRVAHSHSTGYMTQSWAKTLVGDMLKERLKRYANYHFACSIDAGKWMFGKDFEPGVNGYVLNNAVDVSAYRYSLERQDAARRALGIDSKARVLVNVGRLEPVKNHMFLLQIFRQLHDMNGQTVLLLVGDGSLRGELEQQACDLGIDGSVRFLGFRDDVPEVLQASDVFVMPSVHEGLPFVAIEAQASGLPCVFSDGVTTEAAVLDSCEYVSLDADVSEWAQCIERVVEKVVRHDACQEIAAAGYDMTIEIRKLEEFYVRTCNVAGSEMR